MLCLHKPVTSLDNVSGAKPLSVNVHVASAQKAWGYQVELQTEHSANHTIVIATRESYVPAQACQTLEQLHWQRCLVEMGFQQIEAVLEHMCIEKLQLAD